MSETTPYHQIAEFVSWLRNGTASDEEVEQHLRILEADLEVWGQNIRALSGPTEAAPLLEQSLKGLDLFRDAITFIREYMRDRTEESADAALLAGRQGVELILRVKGATEDNIERIIDEAESTK